MSERKWTPGPWIGGTWEGDDKCEVLDDNLMLVARTKTQANAHLIAAAQDLYEALEAAFNHLDYDKDEETYMMVHDALAKARGETQ